MRAARWSAVAVAVVFLAGCGQTHAQTHRDSTLRLSAKDNHKEFTVRPHEAIVVTLSSNRSTGYRWESAPASQVNPGFRLVSHRYYDAPNKSLPGAAGEEVWRLRPVGKGGADLGFLYVQTSQRHQPPARDVDFNIVVR
jgi:predicted secreted protein